MIFSEEVSLSDEGAGELEHGCGDDFSLSSRRGAVAIAGRFVRDYLERAVGF